MEIHATIPLLRIFDEDRARGFYVDYLGFTVDWEHRFEPRAPLYLQVSRDGCVLHLTEHHGDCCPGATTFVSMQGLDGYHAELTARDYPYMNPAIVAAPWNARLMEVTDPFGNRLRFSEPLGEHD